MTGDSLQDGSPESAGHRPSQRERRRSGCLRVTSPSAPEPAGQGELWDSWGALTRFLESARIALARERDLWTSLELDKRLDILRSVLVHS